MLIVSRPGYNFDFNAGTPASIGSFSNLDLFRRHGYDPTLSEMKAILYAAGPDFKAMKLKEIDNIDVRRPSRTCSGSTRRPTTGKDTQQFPEIGQRIVIVARAHLSVPCHCCPYDRREFGCRKLLLVRRVKPRIKSFGPNVITGHSI